MPRHLFEIDCPCCGKRIEIDTRSGKARAVRARDSKDLDRLVDEHRHEDERLRSLFEEAAKDHAHYNERLEDLFKQAAEEAEKHKDEKPPNPFDYE